MLRQTIRSNSTARTPSLQGSRMSWATTTQQHDPRASTPTVKYGQAGKWLSVGAGSLLMAASERWLDPALPLSAEIAQEIDRRRAVRLDLQALQQLADALILDWYRHQQMLGCCLRRVQLLEVQLELAQAPPMSRKPSAQHQALARELRAELRPPDPPASG